ncbi:MAG: EAL domain-containing protein [Bacilli bacterium]|nr:EAL domain-containing protein [Bacilli bacterium]
MDILNRKKRDAFYRLFFSKETKDFSIVDFLNDSSCDEVVDLDVKRDTFRQIFHKEGKYFVPIVQSSFRKLYDFSCQYIVHPDDREIFEDLMDPDYIFERIHQSDFPNFRYAQFRYKLQNGEYRYVEQCIVAGKENGVEEGMIRLYVFDIQNRKDRETGQIVNDDNVIIKDRDTITGLLVSRRFFERAQELMVEKPDVDWCVLSIDVEKFKLYNEWFGRSAGDLLLARIGAILGVRDNQFGGVSGYFGHDNFSILIPYDMDHINALYDEIKVMISSTGHSFGFLPAFGIAPVKIPEDIFNAFDRSNVAVTKAKSDIKKRIYIYGPELQSGIENEKRILADFMEALRQNEITFYLQPQCRISSHKIVGAEALARWIKPSGEVVSPAIFVPLLEKYGFIIDLDQYIWEKICIWIREMLDKGIKMVPISVNVSRADIFSMDILDFFEKMTKKYHIPPRLLKLEITESAYAETTSVIAELVEKLRKKGFMVLMDDFGSGYSSLNMLSTLKVDAIKLDAMFLNIGEESYDKGIHILESVVNMAKIIGLPIIVEGVENKKQCDFLEDLGCRYIQGFYFYKGMPKDEMERLLSDIENIDERGFVVKSNEQFRIREFLDKNVYSDSMLNNIIGAVAYYSWHDNHVDIVRFNEQFYKDIDVPEMHERLENIEQYMPNGDDQILLSLLEKAIQDKLNGAVGIVRFQTPKGAILSFNIHFYYLGEKEGSKRFYGSLQNATELIEARQQLSLISSFSSETIIFLRKFNEDWSFLVTAYGLRNEMQLSKEEFQDTLNKGSLYKLFANRSYYESLRKKVSSMVRENQTFSLVLNVLNPYRELINLSAKFTPVPDQSNNIKYIIQIKNY